MTKPLFILFVVFRTKTIRRYWKPMGLPIKPNMFEEEPHRAISFTSEWDKLEPDWGEDIPDLIIANDQLIEKTSTFNSLLSIKEKYSGLYCLFHQGREDDFQEQNRRSEWRDVVINFWGASNDFFEIDLHTNNNQVGQALNQVKKGKENKDIVPYREGLHRLKSFFTQEEDELNHNLHLLHLAHNPLELKTYMSEVEGLFETRFASAKEGLPTLKEALQSLENPSITLRQRHQLIKRIHQILFP